jgi:hypothetical protein
MGRRMTWEEMKKTFPDEWLLVTEYEADEYGNVKSGHVERHSRDDREVFRPPALKESCAFVYTGESTFPGGWRAHAELHKV